jgi:Fe2+ transport system protein FeoA
MTLADLNIGETAIIVWIHAVNELGDRLMEMGLTPGIPITLVRRGPFGNPAQILVRGYNLSLHRDQTQSIEVRR